MMTKKIFIFGSVAYALLLVMASYFFKERVLFIDGAYYLFDMLRTQNFNIESFRWSAVFTQILPVLAIQLKAPLATVAHLYSINFILFNYAVFLLFVCWLKAPKYAIVLLLFNTFMLNDSFYWTLSELQQSVLFILLFFALLMKKRANPISIFEFGILGFLLAAIAFAHPLALVPFSFATAFFFLSKAISNKHIGVIILAFAVLFVVKMAFFSSYHDNSSMSSAKNFIHFFPNYFNLPSNILFLKQLVFKFHWFSILLIATCTFYIQQRNFKKLILILVFLISYVLLINVSYPNAEFDFYFENLYLPIGLFALFPFVFDWMDKLPKRAVIISLYIIVFTSIVRIYYCHSPFTERISWQNSLIEKYNNEKVIIDAATVPMDTVVMSWSSAYEFALLSTINKNKTTSILITEDPKALEWALPSTDKFVTVWSVFDYADLPNTYFKFDNSSSYRKQP